MSKTVESTSDERTVNNTMRQQYRVLDDEEKTDVNALKGAGEEMLRNIDTVASHYTKDSDRHREFQLARTKIEECVMWAVKGVTR